MAEEKKTDASSEDAAQQVSELMEIVAALNRHAPHLDSRRLIEAWLQAEVDKQVAEAIVPSAGGFAAAPKEKPPGLVFVHRYGLAVEFATANWTEFRGKLDSGIIQHTVNNLKVGITENVYQLHREHPGHNISCSYTITPSRDGNRFFLNMSAHLHAWLAPTN
jgi:hypothetical protein